MAGALRTRLALASSLAVAAWGCSPTSPDPAPDSVAAAPALSPEEAGEAAIAAQRPADEASLMHWDAAYAAVTSAPNEIIRGRVEKEQDERFCSAVHRIETIRNWTGTIREIKFNGYFEVDAGGYITLADPDIRPGSRLFATLSGLKEGQAVRLSGRLGHDDTCSALSGRRLTVHLSSIAPL